ncbi:hypothetical protein ABPG72_005127 [Tetrahymena utriculariae]
MAAGNSQQAEDAANKFASYFEDKKPSSGATADDLGVCSQSGSYTGKQSCCDAKITKFLEKAVLQKVKPLQTQNGIINKLLNILAKLINKTTCPALQGVTKPATGKDFLSNTNLAKLQALLTQGKNCKIQFAKTQVQFARGAVCTVCAGVDQLSSLFDSSGKLIISQSSSDAYQTATTQSLQCFIDLITWGTAGSGGIFDVVSEIITTYVGDKCADKAKILSKAQNILQNHGIKTNSCKSTTVYSKQPNCDGAQQGDSTLESQADSSLGRRFLEQMEFENIRVLQTADSTTSSSGGVNILVTSTTDSTIDADGNVDATTDTPGSSVINSFLLSSIAILLLIIY